jgi:hypothetical protein
MQALLGYIRSTPHFPAANHSRNLIFPNGQSTDARPNTVMDLQRYQDDVAAEIPGRQPQLPPLSAYYNFRNGYIGSWTLSVERQFGDFDAKVAYVGTAGIQLPSVFYPNRTPGRIPSLLRSGSSTPPANQSEAPARFTSSPTNPIPPTTHCRLA